MSNLLKISCPDVTASVGEVTLNGKRLDDVVAFKVEASATEPYVKATIEFLSAIEFDAAGNVYIEGKELELRTR